MILQETIHNIKQLIIDSDAVLIGAGAGLSTAAGLSYSGKRFTDNFPDFIEKYHLTDMYSSAFYTFPTPEEKWAYFSRHIQLNRYTSPVGEIYNKLLNLVQKKDYFILTTNGDGQFERAGFADERIFASQGDYSKFQCSKACHNTLYDNKELVYKMVEQQKDFKIPSELIPTCPVCGEPLVTNLRMDNYFVEDNHWHKASERYIDFIKKSRNKKILLLELGVGYNTPSIIRWPFEQFANDIKESHLVRVNMDNVEPRYRIPQRSILLEADIAEFINQLAKS